MKSRKPEIELAPGSEDDDELEQIAAIGAEWSKHLCRCGHRRSLHPNHDMRDPTRNSCRAKRCRCKWFTDRSVDDDLLFRASVIAKALAPFRLVVGVTSDGELKVYRQPKPIVGG